MPILVRDPWRIQYFSSTQCPDDVIVPIDDMDAWVLYPAARHVYDRLFVASVQGLACGPHGTTPTEFPIFSKPIINLKGMGIGSRVIQSQAAYDQSYEAGHFWMPVLDGAHVSTDCAVIKGEIVWMRHATGTPFRDGMFQYWTIHTQRDQELEKAISAFTRAHLSAYVGMVNFETIGGRIIEVHLRFADQWCDIYGAGWIAAVVDLYRHEKWTYRGADREGFSIPLFADDRSSYQLPPLAVQSAIRAMPEISSLQITFDPEKPIADHARPPGGMRLVLINAWSLTAGMAAIDAIAEAFPARLLIRP